MPRSSNGKTPRAIIDAPAAEGIYQELLGTLILIDGFTPCLLRSTTSLPSPALGYRLLLGTLRLVKNRRGQEGLRRAFPVLEEPMCTLSGAIGVAELRQDVSRALACTW